MAPVLNLHLILDKRPRIDPVLNLDDDALDFFLVPFRKSLPNSVAQGLLIKTFNSFFSVSDPL